MKAQRIKIIWVSILVVFFFFGAQMAFAFSNVPKYPKILTKKDYHKQRKKFKISKKIKTGLAAAMDKAEDAYKDGNFSNYEAPDKYSSNRHLEAMGLKKVISFEKKFKAEYNKRHARMWKALSKITDLSENAKGNDKISADGRKHMKKIWIKSDNFSTELRRALRQGMAKEEKVFKDAKKYLKSLGQ